MRAVTIMAPLGLTCALWLPAQDASNVKIDEPRARVLVVTEEPHHPSTLHEHTMNRVLIYLGNGRMKFTKPDGKVEQLAVKSGDVRWSPPQGPHISENTGDQSFRVVEIELKNAPHPGVLLSDLDPLKTDPKHYSLELENDQVRVLRVRFGPNEQGVRHEHKLDHIVVYLTDQARGKAGEVRLDGPMTHSEQNPLDRAVERIAIDLK